MAGFFLVESRGLFHCIGIVAGAVIGQRCVIALPLARRVPVDQIRGQLFPCAAALVGDVTHAIAYDLILAHELIAAIFENEPAVGVGSRRVRLEGERLLGVDAHGARGEQHDRKRTGKESAKIEGGSHRRAHCLFAIHIQV